MAVDGITRIESVSPLRSTLKVGAQGAENRRGAQVSEKERKDFPDEQTKKAAEEAERRQQQKQEQQKQEQELDMLRRELEASNEQSDAMEDAAEAFSKCMKIAARIAKGDIVPSKDIRYLAKHEPDLYKQAILLRTPAPKPKKHRSITDDEDEETVRYENAQSSDISAAEETATPEEGEESDEPDIIYK